MLFRPPTPLQMLLTGAGAAGGGGAAPFVGPLDDYTSGMKSCWSVYRRMLASHTGALARIRRDGDDAETDLMPQTDGTIDVPTLEAWCIAGGGFGYGYVVTVYDQSGNGLDLEQATAGAQMMLVDQGNILLLGNSGGQYPCMSPVDGNQLYVTQTFSPAYTGEDAWLFTHQQAGNASDVWNSISLTSDLQNSWDSSERAVILSMSAGLFDAIRTGVHSAGSMSNTDAMLISARFGASGWEVNYGGSGGNDYSTDMQGTFNSNRFLLAAFNSSTPYGGVTMKFTEAVVYLSNKTADEGGIRLAMALDI